jgi:hypothetical protein
MKVLVLITIFLITLTVDATAVWLYRLVSKWHGFNQPIVGYSGNTTLIKLQAQQGFVSLTSSFRDGAKHKKLRSPKGGFKTPWGW